MTTVTNVNRNRRNRIFQVSLSRFACVGALALCLTAAPVRAQDQEGPSPQEIMEKVKEVDRLMKRAEQSLVRSTDSRTADQRSRDAARELEKLLDDNARSETGKGADQLREEAAAGSKDAEETLSKLMRRTSEQMQKLAAKRMREIMEGGSEGSGGAGSGIRKLLEKSKGESNGVTQGIEWVLKNATSSSSGSSGMDSDQNKPGEKNKDKPDKNEPEDDPEQSGDQKPPDKTGEPPSPQKDAWLADLPPQVRKAYETEDWDSIPPRWRRILRQWTLKLARDLEKNR